MDNIHATGLVLGDQGVLVTGPSGSGKTTLALALVARCRASGMFARLVSDDQLLLRARQGRLVASAPPSIAGLAEIRGFGPAPVPFEGAIVVDLMVGLVPASQVERLDPGVSDHVLGVRIPYLAVPERSIDVAAPAVLARLLSPRDRVIVS